jgi:hypothetical protein
MGVRWKGTCVALYSERFSNAFRGSARTALGRVYEADDKATSKDLQKQPFVRMERTEIEPLTSGLETHPIARRSPTRPTKPARLSQGRSLE